MKLPFETEYNNHCLLCGKEMEEHFFSGSYETYTNCSCEGRKKLGTLCDQINVIARKAGENLDKAKNKERRAQLKAELARLGGE